MKKLRRQMEGCETVTENFLKDNARFEATDGYWLTWCRMGNGGDPPYHLGPFIEDQLYLTHGELMTAYPTAGLELYTVPDLDTNEVFFPVISGALLAYKKLDPEDDGWIYHEGKWHRMPAFSP